MNLKVNMPNSIAGIIKCSLIEIFLSRFFGKSIGHFYIYEIVVIWNLVMSRKSLDLRVFMRKLDKSIVFLGKQHTLLVRYTN
jgi:hypothetical protein